MVMIVNIIVIGVVLFIAYWWATQGLFSAILHTVCVVAAGAITLAAWEPLTTGYFLRGNDFDNYAWGISFVMIFAVSLVILRVTMDKTIRANVETPLWANWAFGLPIGAVAGVLTMGLFIIGAGFVQSNRSIIGFTGAARSSDRSARVEEVNRLWLPVHEWTYEFYSWLSVTSLSTDKPLRYYYPELHLQATSLVRDSFKNGRGKLALRPRDARADRLLWDRQGNRYAVAMTFDAGARDYGEQLTLSSAQVRLIGHGTDKDEANVVHPAFWSQWSGRYQFDDISHYVTSEPGQQQTKVIFEFNGSDLGTQAPRFIQVRGTRYLLPRPQEVSAAEFSEGAIVSAGAGATGIDQSAPSIQSAIEQSNGIRPVRASTNLLPGNIKTTEMFISGGDGEFTRGGAGIIARTLEVKGIFEPSGTRCVQLDVSRGSSPADIFGSIRNQVDEDAELMLVDSNGRTYRPIGYIHEQPDGKTRINIDFVNFVSRAGQLPVLPSSGTHKLKLLFNVTDEATIVGFRFGTVTVGTCQLEVRDPRGPRKQSEQGESPAL